MESSCDLPRLPVPALEQTMRLYLEAVEVIIEDEEQLKRTRSYVEEFMRPNGIGAKLQQLLIEKQQREENWVWFITHFYLNLFIDSFFHSQSFCNVNILILMIISHGQINTEFFKNLKFFLCSVFFFLLMMNFMNVIKAYDWWLNDMYMDNPIPLPVNSNPGMVFPPRQIPKNDPEAFLTDIADLVNNILDQKDIIEMYHVQ